VSFYKNLPIILSVLHGSGKNFRSLGIQSPSWLPSLKQAPHHSSGNRNSPLLIPLGPKNIILSALRSPERRPVGPREGRGRGKVREGIGLKDN
jgi:hypothetical protein